MSKKEKLKKNPVRLLSLSAVSETFSAFKILMVGIFANIEYRLKELWVSSVAIKEAAGAQGLDRWMSSHFLIQTIILAFLMAS